MHRNRSVYKVVLAATLSLQFACQPTLALPNRTTVTVPMRGTSLNQLLNSSKGSTLGKVATPFNRYETIFNATQRPAEDAKAEQSSTLQHFFLIGNAAAQLVASGKSDTTPGAQDKSLSSRIIINSLNSTYKGDQVYLMEPGSLLIMHDSPVSLQTNEGNVHISKGSVAFVVQIGQEVAVYNLTGDKTGTVAAKVGSQVIPIPLGHAVILSEVSSNIKKCPVSQCIDLNSAVNFARVGAVNVIAAKFNYSSALDNCPQFQEFVNSKIPDQRKTADLLLKYTAAQASAGGDAEQGFAQSTGQPGEKTEQIRANRSRDNVFVALSSTASNSSTASGTTSSGSTSGNNTNNNPNNSSTGSGSGTAGGVGSNPPPGLNGMSPAEWKTLVTGVSTAVKIYSKVKNFTVDGPKSPDRKPPTGDKNSPNPDENPNGENGNGQTGGAQNNGNQGGDNQPDQDPGTGSQNSTNSVTDPDDNLSPNTIRIISQESAPKEMGLDEPGAPKMLEPAQIINQTAEAADKSFEDDPDEPLEDDPDFIPIELSKLVQKGMFGFQPIGKLVPTTTKIKNTTHLKLKGILNIGPQFTTPSGWNYVGVPLSITNYNAAVTNTYAQYKICLECGAKINALTPKITSTQNKITTLQTQITGVQQQLATISTLQAQYNSWPKQEQLQNRGEEQKLSSAQKSLNQTLQSLNTQLQAQQSTLNTLQSTVQTLTAQGNAAAMLENMYEQQVSILYGILPKAWCAWQQTQVST